jgi:Ribonuclease G/E
LKTTDLQYISDSLQTFQRVRINRQGRLRGKLRKRKYEEESYANMMCQSCPVCHGRLQRTQEEIAQHIEDCVRKVNNFDIISVSHIFASIQNE